MALTARQKKFADEWMESFKITESALKAGYSERSAASIGSENLKKPEILEYIHARMRERAAAPEEAIAFLTAVMRGQIKDQFGLEAALSDRLRACENLMKRYAATEDKTKGTMEKLDKLLEGIGNAAEQ